VTAAGGLILIALSLLAPLGRLVNSIPGFGGLAETAIIVVLHHRRDGHRYPA